MKRTTKPNNTTKKPVVRKKVEEITEAPHTHPAITIGSTEPVGPSFTEDEPSK